MKKILDAIFFDFDGTLANTLPLIFHSFKELFKEYKNKDISPDDIVKMFGPTEVGIIREQFRENTDSIIGRFYKIYEEKHPDFLHKEEEFIDLLKFLKSKNLILGIVTGKGKNTLDISLRLLKMTSYFDVLISGDDVRKPKPDPEGINKALTITGIKAERILFVGDSDADIGAGENAKVLYTIGVNWLSDFIELKLKPDYFFNNVNDFKVFIDKLLS